MRCPHCGKSIEVRSQDHIFPRFMGGTRKTTTCKRCNDRFGNTIERRAALIFHKFHFYLASHGVPLNVELTRWRNAFQEDGVWYDAEFCDQEVRFTLSKPLIQMDEDRMVMNAQFGSRKQMESLLKGIRRKGGMVPPHEISITPTVMPEQEIRFGTDDMKLAVKMCSALSSLLPAFYTPWATPPRARVTFDFRTLPIPDAPPLAHTIYVETTPTGIQGIVRLFGVHQVFCTVRSEVDLVHPSAQFRLGMAAYLDPVTATEVFVEVPRIGLEEPPSKVGNEQIKQGLDRWGTLFRDAAILRGASQSIQLSLKDGSSASSPLTTPPPTE